MREVSGDGPLAADEAGPGALHTALEDLLAVIAHELRAPLTVVATAADTIAAGRLGDGQLEPLLQVIRRNAELALLLTDRLRLAREVEAGAFRLNAVKYSPVGSQIQVTVGVDQGGATLSVRDHGRGIERTQFEQIFEKYTQLDPTVAGVGLGLYIARGLARANGGDLTVEAPPGGGSRFTLRLAVAAPLA